MYEEDINLFVAFKLLTGIQLFNNCVRSSSGVLKLHKLQGASAPLAYCNGLTVISPSCTHSVCVIQDYPQPVECCVPWDSIQGRVYHLSLHITLYSVNSV